MAEAPQPPTPLPPPRPAFDRERFVLKTLAVVIGAQLLIYGTLEKPQSGFDSTLDFLLALLGGAALSRAGPPF